MVKDNTEFESMGRSVMSISNEKTTIQNDEVTIENSIPQNRRKGHCYSIWLDCPINASNRLWFVTANLLTAFAYLCGMNIAIVDACHLIVLFRISKINILMPYKCVGVFEEYE